MKVAVIGAGAIGSVIAASLILKGGHQVFLCARRQIQSINLISWAGQSITATPICTRVPDTASTVDVVLVCTKAHDAGTTWPWLQRLCDRNTVVAVVQNGIEHVESLPTEARHLPVVPMIAYFSAESLQDGVVRYGHVGEVDMICAPVSAADRILTLFDAAMLNVRIDMDFEQAKWRKLIINSVAGPITVLTYRRMEVFRNQSVKALATKLAYEALEVANAHGAKLPPETVPRLVDQLVAIAPDMATSMYSDRRAGRALEIDAITGTIIRRANMYGINVPTYRTLDVLCRNLSGVQ